MRLLALTKKLEDYLVDTQVAGQARLSLHLGRRDDFVKASLQGGKAALARLKKYGATEDREDVQWMPWFEEYIEAIADFRLAHVLTTGSAQIGKTLGATLVEVDTIVYGRCQTAWFYADASAVDLNVPDQFRPVVEEYVSRLATETGKEFDRSGDRLINSRYEVEGVGGIFSFANTSQAKPSRRGKAAAGSKGVSFPADMVFYEEKSQWLTNVDYSARMNASCIPTHPTRELGTPGSGGGIEAAMQDCDRYFYPHVTCPHCQELIQLSPKGCLLKATQTKDAMGQDKVAYLSASGRPLEWMHSDPADAIGSAYIGCSKCDRPIPDKARFDARFHCVQTGVSLRDYLDSLPSGVPAKQLKVGLHLSPLVRKTEYNLAVDLITKGLNKGSADDWQQQDLGFPSESTQNSLTLEILKRSLYAPPPQQQPTITIAGIDQGRSELWIWITQFCAPENYRALPVQKVLDQTIQKVLWAGPAIKTAVPDRLKEYGVQYGLIDNEPDRTDAAEIAAASVLKMADQKPGQIDDVKKIEVETNGISYKCWGIANSVFLKRTLNSFLLCDRDGYPLQRLPQDWERWLNNPSELSPLRHLTGPSYDPETGKWARGAGNVDDLYYACMFAQAAFYIWLTQEKAVKRKPIAPVSYSTY